jgi:mono/diheme cytochrome c family protein
MRHWVVAGVVAAFFVVATPASLPLRAASPARQSAHPPASAAAERALLDRYCVTCHNQKAKTAGVMFDTLDVAHVGKDAAVWERAVRKLRGGMMPPLGMPRPDQASINSLVKFLETSLDQAALASPDPGAVALHRLNRAEYQNAIADVLGVHIDAAALLPRDDISDGFDNIASVLKVSPAFLDQYIAAAREVSRRAILGPPPNEPVQVTLRGEPADPADLPLGTQGGIVAKHLFPYDADYMVSISGPDLIFTIDGVPVSVAGGFVHITAGVHRLGLTAKAHSFAEPEGMLQSFIPGHAYPGYGFAPGAGGAGGRRAPAGPSIEIIGPYHPSGKPAETESRARVFVCHPPAESEEASCAARILSGLAERAFRRPVTSKDLAAPMAFFKQGREDSGTFEGGIQNGIIAILASPKFLYRAEPPPAGLAAGTNYRISDLELASRLSFFLWSTVPDDELLRVAEQGKLRDSKVYEQQVRRLLASDKSQSLVTNFASEWLRLRDIDTIDPDPFIYPEFDPALRTAFRRELELFVDSIQREDRSVLDLLDANYTFVNERLALHYGIPNVRGDEFRRVILPDSKRYGLLGKGAVLMVTSYANRTSVVLRGNYILENILGTPPSPPPPNVPAFKENKEGEKPHTVRETMELHRANPVCNGCHGIIDPLGFALENFDTVGAWRDKDRYTRTAIDASGKLVDGTVVDGPDDLRKALLARRSQFVETMTEKFLMYALGRPLSPYDMPAVRKIVRDAAPDNYRFSSIVMGIAESLPFEMERTPEAPAKPVQAAAARQ